MEGEGVGVGGEAYIRVLWGISKFEQLRTYLKNTMTYLDIIYFSLNNYNSCKIEYYFIEKILI